MVWNEEDAKTVKRFVKRNEINYPVLLRGAGVGSDWGVRLLPANFLIDQVGDVSKRFSELTYRNLPHVERRIKSLLE
jgi:hypothetical protein